MKRELRSIYQVFENNDSRVTFRVSVGMNKPVSWKKWFFGKLVPVAEIRIHFESIDNKVRLSKIIEFNYEDDIVWVEKLIELFNTHIVLDEHT